MAHATSDRSHIHVPDDVVTGYGDNAMVIGFDDLVAVIGCDSSYWLVAMEDAALLISRDRCLVAHYGGHNAVVRSGADVAFVGR